MNPRTFPNRREVLALGVASASASAATLGLALSTPARAAARRTLTVAAFPLVDEIVRNAMPAWKARHPDVDVEVVTRQYADHHTAMTTALSTAVRLPDVMATEQSYLGRFAQGEGLENLRRPPFDVDRFRTRFVAYAWDQATNRRGEVVALPTDIGPGTLLYRRDLLEKAGISESSLLPTWDAYVEAGVRIQRVTGAALLGNVQMLKDIIIRSGLKPGDGLYYDSESNVLVEAPRFRRAFELARTMRRQRLDAHVTDWSNEWAEALRRGQIATLVTGAWMAGQLSNWVAPSTRGLWRAAPMPENTFVSYGGTFYALPRHAPPENKELAWELMQLLTLDRTRQLDALKTQDAFPALLAAQDDPFFDGEVPFLGGQRARVLWRDTARRITAMAVHKQNSFAEEVINTELGNVLDRGKSIDLALADAKRLLERRAHR